MYTHLNPACTIGNPYLFVIFSLPRNTYLFLTQLLVIFLETLIPQNPQQHRTKYNLSKQYHVLDAYLSNG